MKRASCYNNPAMKQIPFAVVDAFTTEPFAGNPAGVFFDDDAQLTWDEMRRLAGEVHLESAFVSPGDGPFRYQMQYFTGLTEVPFCGHATIAAVTALAARGDELSDGGAGFTVQIPPGSLSVTVHPSPTPGSPFVTLGQKAPEIGASGDASIRGVVCTALGIEHDALHPTLPVQRVSTGTPWVFVPVLSRETVNRQPSDFEMIAQFSEVSQAWGLYVFCVEPRDDGVSVWSRCYAPRAGLNEDPVTGSGCGALGGYLAHHGVLSPTENAPADFTVAQGFGGGRGGTAQVSVFWRDGELRPFVRGCAVVVAEGVFTLP